MKDLIKAREEKIAKRKDAEAARDEAASPFEKAVVNAKKEEEIIENEIRKERNALIVKHIDVLLELRPVHDRTSCSDEDPNNERRCGRCALLYIKACDFNAEEVSIDILVSHTRLD